MVQEQEGVRLSTRGWTANANTSVTSSRFC